MKPFRWAFVIASSFVVLGWLSESHDDLLSWVASARTADVLVTVGRALLSAPAGMAFLLFARVNDDEMLLNENRRRIHEFVSKNPGVSLSEISESLALGWGTTVHHVERLESAALLRSEMDGRRRAFMVGGGQLSGLGAGYLTKMLPARARLFEAVRVRPGATQGELAVSAGLSLPVAHRHLRRLEEAGFIASRKNWKTRIYEVSCVHASQISQMENSPSHTLAIVSPRGTSIE